MKWVLIIAVMSGHWFVGDLDPQIQKVEKIAAFDTKDQCESAAKEIAIKGKILTKCLYGYDQ